MNDLKNPSIKIRKWSPSDALALAEAFNNRRVLDKQNNIHNRTAEMGYYLDEKYWGRGIMTVAVSLLCDYVFTRSDIVRIYAEPFSTNIPSCRVLEKAGFTCEATIRDSAFKDNRLLDQKLYAILSPTVS